jgi:hypothetical protein
MIVQTLKPGNILGPILKDDEAVLNMMPKEAPIMDPYYPIRGHHFTGRVIADFLKPNKSRSMLLDLSFSKR